MVQQDDNTNLKKSYSKLVDKGYTVYLFILKTKRHNEERQLKNMHTSFGNLRKKDISSAGWSSPSPPARTFPGVASRTQTCGKKIFIHIRGKRKEKCYRTKKNYNTPHARSNKVQFDIEIREYIWSTL